MGRVRGPVPGHDKAQPKPLTPLLAPIRVAMKPLTPLRGANRHSLKPRAPLQAETRLVSAIFRPQWCQWFHSTMITGQQRCPRFHPRRSAASKGVLSFMQRTCPGVPPLRRPHTKSHAIPLSPAPTRAHKRWNLKDLLPRLEGLAGELHAKLQSPRLETATRTARSVRSGTAKPATPARTIMPQVLGDLDARCYKRRQIGAFSTDQYGVLLQTSSNQAQNTRFLAK